MFSSQKNFNNFMERQRPIVQPSELKFKSGNLNCNSFRFSFAVPKLDALDHSIRRDALFLAGKAPKPQTINFDKKTKFSIEIGYSSSFDLSLDSDSKIEIYHTQCKNVGSVLLNHDRARQISCTSFHISLCVVVEIDVPWDSNQEEKWGPFFREWGDTEFGDALLYLNETLKLNTYVMAV